MSPASFLSRFQCRLLVVALLVQLAGSVCSAATPAEVKTAIARGAGYLQGQVNQANGGLQTLLALALYKATQSPDSPGLQPTLQRVLQKFATGVYVPDAEHLYEAGLEATLLSDLDAEKYKPQLQMLRDYFVAQQLPNGSWDYPNSQQTRGTNGDTSVIQYACLGLWAIERAGVEVDPSVWERVLQWHIQNQNPDGGYSYCPGTGQGEFGTNSALNMSVNAVGNIMMAAIHINPNIKSLEQVGATPKPAATDEKPPLKFGLLEAVRPDDSDPKKAVKASIPSGAAGTIRKTLGFVEARFLVDNKSSLFRSYYYYSLERTAALANLTRIGSHEWFDECSSFIVSNQEADGSWKLSPGNHLSQNHDTAFCVLFLTKSTGKLLRRVVEPGYGDGTLAGGRGLPDDLAEAQFNGRQVMTKEKPTEPLDQLLASLQATGNIDLQDVPEKIVEKVQLGDRTLLIGQIDRLLQLVEHPSADVRRTAIWAIGRSDRLDLGTYLIRALDDPDLGVMIEARNALCWLSRKPAGFGEPEDPLAGLPPDASDQQKKDAIAAWHKNVVLAWGKWYLDNRPFDRRGDEFEARLRLEMEQLKYGLAPAANPIPAK